MKNIYPHFTAEYSLANTLETLGCHKDCLNVMRRRCLYSTFYKRKKGMNISPQVVTSLIKDNFTVHGSDGVYKSIVTLSRRTFLQNKNKSIDENNQYFIQLNGSKGKQGFPEDCMAGADRYTSLKHNDLLSKYFDYLKENDSDIVDFLASSKTGSDSNYKREPEYLPFIVPLGLIGNTISFHLGALYAPITPQYKLSDLLIRQHDLIKNNGKSDIIIKPFIENCKLIEKKEGEFKRLLETGEGDFNCVPNFEVVEIKKKRKTEKAILLKGKHPQKGFGQIPSENEDLSEKNAINLNVYNAKYEDKYGSPFFYYQDIADKNYKGYNNFATQIMKGDKNVKFEDFYTIVKDLISGTINFRCIFMDSDKFNTMRKLKEVKITDPDNFIKIYSIDELLINSYNDCIRIESSIIDKQIENLKKEIRKLTISIAISDVYQNNIDRIKKSKNEYEEILLIYKNDYLDKKYNYKYEEFVSILDTISLKDMSLNKNKIQKLENKINVKNQEKLNIRLLINNYALDLVKLEKS